jgi:hypothetical protein
MKILKFVLFSYFLIVFFCGCDGIKFKDERVNLDLPDDFKYRTPIKNTADMRFHMEENLGLLVTEDSEKHTYKMLSNPILPENFTPREEVIKDGKVYSSKITQKASAKGSYLSIVAASLSAEEVLEYRIVDMARVDVPWTQFPEAEIRNFADSSNPNNLKRLWIQSMILSRVISQSYTKIECSSSNSGPAFKVEGNCFNSTGIENFDYAIGVVFIDIDEYIRNNPGSTRTETTKDTFKALEALRNESLSGKKTPTSEIKLKHKIPKFISIEPSYYDLKAKMERSGPQG